jgi:hypothetical protein
VLDQVDDGRVEQVAERSADADEEYVGLSRDGLELAGDGLGRDASVGAGYGGPWDDNPSACLKFADDLVVGVRVVPRREPYMVARLERCLGGAGPELLAAAPAG